MPRKKASTKPSRLFVLDTNVFLHDPYCALKFSEHDVFVPFVTLEELDNKKSGNSDLNRNAREATRLIEEIVTQPGHAMAEGFPLLGVRGAQAKGRLFMQKDSLPFLANEHLRKNDNLYLAVLDYLQRQYPTKEVLMVTKDINLRIKARAMGFKAEDYRHDHAVEDADLMYRGWRPVTEQELEAWAQDMQSRGGREGAVYRVPHTDQRYNEFLVFPGGELFRVGQIEDGYCFLHEVVDTTKERNAVLGVRARNEEQRAALSLLLNPDVDLVALLGPAGTGKTLLALAAALQQIKQGRFDSILFTRANTPLGEDIGFLPGTEEEKMNPWMGALFDNIDVLAEMQGNPVAAQKFREETKELVEVRAMTFMRGRTFIRRLIILDEAQNLTPKQMKALITRAGDGTKVVALGNLAQIDSPYLSETSSGLSYLVERFKGWPHFGSLILDKGERSRLATAGNERL